MVRFLKISALVSAVVLLNSITTLLFVQSRTPASAQVGPPPCVDGDVNGDAALNIGDPTYLLQHLFQGGPGPVACAQGPTPVIGLPDTGQTTCFGGFPPFGVVACASDPCGGQDGAYDTGCSSVGRFIENLDGTVTDTCTGLMWQQDTADTNGDALRDFADGLPWCNALDYCENLSFAGHSDWRLPNVRELQSIVDYGIPIPGPTVDPVFGAMTVLYWSSASYAGNPVVAWLVSFYDGQVGLDGKASVFLVRAVRNGP